MINFLALEILVKEIVLDTAKGTAQITCLHLNLVILPFSVSQITVV